MKSFALQAVCFLTLSSVIFAQGPSLPTLPPPAPEVPPVPMFQPQSDPLPTQVRKIPQAEVQPVSPLVPPVPTPVEMKSPTTPSQVVTPQNQPATAAPAPMEMIQPYPSHSATYPPAYENHPPANTFSPQPIFGPQPSYVLPQESYYYSYPMMEHGINPAGAEGVYVGPAISGGQHPRFPLYDYRRPWYTRGPASRTIDIVW